MKTWLVIVSVVVVLLAASIGVGFWMLTEAKAELTDARAELTNTKAELTEIQEELEGNFGNWQKTVPPWEGYAEREPTIPVWGQETSEGKYPWCQGIEETISDLEQRVEDIEWPIGQAGSISDIEQRVEELEWAVRDLEWTVEDLEQQLQILESTLHIYGIY
jgi:peptidoglycan hydrolase CwlO-like protein